MTRLGGTSCFIMLDYCLMTMAQCHPVRHRNSSDLPVRREKSNRKYITAVCIVLLPFINIWFFFFIIYYLDINRYLFLSSIASESDSGSGLMFLINLLAGILSVYPNVYIPLDLLLQFMTS